MSPSLEKIYIIHSRPQAQRLLFQAGGYFLFHVKVLFFPRTRSTALLRVSEFHPLALIARLFSLLFSLRPEQFEIVSTAFGHHCVDFKWMQIERKLKELSGNSWTEPSEFLVVKFIAWPVACWGEKSRGEVSWRQPGMELSASVVALVSCSFDTCQLFQEKQFQKVLLWAVKQHLLLCWALGGIQRPRFLVAFHSATRLRTSASWPINGCHSCSHHKRIPNSRKDEEGHTLPLLQRLSRIITQHFHIKLMGQNLLTWSHLVARSVYRKCVWIHCYSE